MFLLVHTWSLSLTVNQCHQIPYSVLHCILKIFEEFLPSCFLALWTIKPCSPYTSPFFSSLSFTSESIREAHWRNQDTIKLLTQSWGCCFYSMLAGEQTPKTHCCLNAACNQYSSLESFLGRAWGLNIWLLSGSVSLQREKMSQRPIERLSSTINWNRIRPAWTFYDLGCESCMVWLCIDGWEEQGVSSRKEFVLLEGEKSECCSLFMLQLQLIQGVWGNSSS